MQGDTVACGGKNLPRAYGHHLGERTTSELCRNGPFYVLARKGLSELSSHLTAFVLPGHVVQDRSIINKGIQFAVKEIRETFITELEGGSDGMAEDRKEAQRCVEVMSQKDGEAQEMK